MHNEKEKNNTKQLDIRKKIKITYSDETPLVFEDVLLSFLMQENIKI